MTTIEEKPAAATVTTHRYHLSFPLSDGSVTNTATVQDGATQTFQLAVADANLTIVTFVAKWTDSPPSRLASAATVSIDPSPEVPAPRPRSAGSGERPRPSRQLPRTGSAAVVTVVPVDASVDVVEEPPPPPPPVLLEKTAPTPKPPTAIDRNQTMNPFANKQRRTP